MSEKIIEDERFLCDVKNVYCELCPECSRRYCVKDRIGKKRSLSEKEKKELSEMPLDTLKQRLHYFIKSSNLTQREIGERAYLSESYINRLANLNDKRTPTSKDVSLLEHALDLPRGTIDGTMPFIRHRKDYEIYYKRYAEKRAAGKEKEEARVIYERHDREKRYLNEYAPPFEFSGSIEKALLDLAASICINLETLQDGRVALAFSDHGQAGELVNQFLTEWKRQRDRLADSAPNQDSEKWELFDLWRADIYGKEGTPGSGYYINDDNNDRPRTVDALPLERYQRTLSPDMVEYYD